MISRQILPSRIVMKSSVYEGVRAIFCQHNFRSLMARSHMVHGSEHVLLTHIM
jgi:hypothetical protein